MRSRDFLKRLKAARASVSAEIEGCARRDSGDMYARGLSSEGYAGGYRQALDDVEAMLRHGGPSDPRGYWGLLP